MLRLDTIIACFRGSLFPHAMSVKFRCTTCGFPLSLGFKNDATVPLETFKNGILHLDAPTTEKIRIDFTDKPLIGFSLIWSLLFAIACIATYNCTIVFLFRIDFPKSKWAESIYTPKKKVYFNLFLQLLVNFLIFDCITIRQFYSEWIVFKI